MKAFHNDPKVKTKVLRQVRAHYEADEIVKGHYWENGKGCAVGCTIHGSNHKDYETELGIPEWLARVEDTIFEGLPNKRAKQWPVEFLKAIKTGVDLNQIKKPFLIFVLENNLKTLTKVKFDAERFPEVKTAIDKTNQALQLMITYHKTGNGKDEAISAADSARSAAYSAYSADSAAYSARSAAYSAYSATYSAYSATYSAYSARSAAYSARSAAYSADSARSAADSAYSAAYSAAYVKFANKLLELMKAVK